MRRNHEALIIAALFVILLVLLFLTGCASEEISRPNRMRIERYDEYRIMVDLETGVQYLSRGDSLCVLVDKDGKPYLANGWRDYE